MRIAVVLLNLLAWSAMAEPFDHNHTAWTAILKAHVSTVGPISTVNYMALKSEVGALNAYTTTLLAVPRAEFDKFTESQKLAFLINLYNALTVKLVVDHYPTKSIKNLGSRSFANPTASPWKTKFFKLFGEDRHLDAIEHEMIRKWFNEPRIHFAVVCASVGCPALRNEAFVSEKLELQLSEAALVFLSDRSRNRIDVEAKKLEISAIFKWYGGDFVKKYGSLESFLAEGLTKDVKVQKSIRAKEFSVSYLDYDWSLNE